jgi:hypothetical protein
MNNYNNLIRSHYERVWSSVGNSISWELGPMAKVSPNFSILRFPPRQERNMWTYATCGMSETKTERSIELHIFSSSEADELVELLTVVAYYHKTEVPLEHGRLRTLTYGKLKCSILMAYPGNYRRS